MHALDVVEEEIVSALMDGVLYLEEGARYRARLFIRAPKLVAGEKRVSGELGLVGFSRIVFYDRAELPCTWPESERTTTPSMFTWTAFLEGTYLGVDAQIPVSMFGEHMAVLGIWKTP